MQIDTGGRVWALRNDPAGVAMAAASRRTPDGEPSELAAASMIRGGERLKGTDFTYVFDGVAVVPAFGVLLSRMSYWFWSYEEIMRDVAVAEASPYVTQIVLHIDSPGGLVAGCEDCADFLANARTNGKLAGAYVNGMCASAAYWLASACGPITVGKGSIVGSIGTVIEYVDIEGIWEGMGAKIVRVVAESSPNKRLDPDTPEGLAELQALVDQSGRNFVQSVAAGRGVAESVVMDAYGQGLVFSAEEAQTRGMVEGFATLSGVVTELADRDVSDVETVAATGAKEVTGDMEYADITLDDLRANRADLVETIETTARTAGADAERTRIIGLEEVSEPGYEADLAAAKADPNMSPGQFAIALRKKMKGKADDFLAQRRADETAAGGVPDAPAGTGQATVVDTSGDPADVAKAEWDADASGKLKGEFISFENYSAFRVAELKGAVSILRRSA